MLLLKYWKKWKATSKLHAYIFATNEKDRDLKAIVINKLKSILCNYTCPWYNSLFWKSKMLLLTTHDIQSHTCFHKESENVYFNMLKMHKQISVDVRSKNYSYSLLSVKFFFNFHQTLASIVRNEKQSPKCHKSTNSCINHEDSANSNSALESWVQGQIQSTD